MLAGPGLVAEAELDQAGVVVEVGVPGAELEGLVHHLGGLLGLVVLEQGPGQGVVAVDVLAVDEVEAGEFQGLGQVAVVVGVEQREGPEVLVLAGGDRDDLLEEGPGLGLAAELDVEVAQGGEHVRVGADGDGLLVEGDGLVEPALAGAEAAEGGGGVVVGVGPRRDRSVVRLGLVDPAGDEGDVAQPGLEPGGPCRRPACGPSPRPRPSA